MVSHGVLAPGWHHCLLGVVPTSPNVRIGIPDGVDNIFKTAILCVLPCGVADLKVKIYRIEKAFRGFCPVVFPALRASTYHG